MEGAIHQFSPSDRALMVISDAMVYGSTRLQKYGFLLHKQYGKEMSRIASSVPELKFYDDWEPLWYGPFSRDLARDIQACVGNGLMYKEQGAPPNSYRYGFTISGRVKWRRMLHEFGDEMTAIHEKVVNLQKVRLERLLESVYNAYPEFAERSAIKDRVLNESTGDGA